MSEYEEDSWSNSFLEWKYISDQINGSLTCFDNEDIDHFAPTEDIYEGMNDYL